MNKARNKNRYSRKWQWLLLTLLSVAGLSSCIADEDLVIGESSPEDPVLIGASVLPSEKTRSYIEEGEIDAGQWWLVYKRTSNYYNRAIVEFGNPEGPTTAYPYFYDDSGVMTELKWKYVYGQGGTKQPFYLTNLAPDLYTTQSSDYLTHLRFNTGVNPFVAAPLDKTNGTNDILIGDATAAASDKKFEIPLYHALSLLKISVEVFGSSDNHYVDLSEAEVTITDLCRTVESVQLDYRTSFRFNESSNTTDSERGGTYSNPGTLLMVNRGDGNTSGPGWENGGPTDLPAEDGRVKKVYSTYEFVMPPQSIPASPLPAVTEDYTGKQPVLRIKVKKSAVTGQSDMEGYVTYSGSIPDIMFTIDEKGVMLPTPERIALKSGTQLCIKATINSPETDLMFAPVTVEPWVSRENFSLNTRQAGIYNENQFWQMVEAYKRNDMYALERFGYWDGDVTQNAGRGNFVFQLWATIPLNENEIRRCLIPRAPSNNPDDVPSSFCFIFNGFYVAYANNMEEVNDNTPRLEGSEGAIEFYNIVTGENEQYIGIKTPENLAAVTSLFSASLPPVKQLLKYGDINNATNNLDFLIERKIDIPIANVFQVCAPVQWGYNVKFDNAEGCYVNAVFSQEDNVTLPLVTVNDYDYFNKVVFIKTASKTIASQEEFYFLINAVNTYYRYFNPIMTLLSVWYDVGNGFNQGNSWNFDFGNGVSGVEAAKVVGCFYDNNTNPDVPKVYLSASSFPVDGFVMENPKTSFSIARATSNNSYQNSASLRPYFFGPSMPTLSTIITAYNNATLNLSYRNLWTYGKFLNDKWVFDFSIPTFNTGTPSATYDAAFGSMKVDDEGGRYDYEFIAGTRGIQITTVTNPQTGARVTITFYNEQNNDEYPNDMQALKAMLNGTYWDYYDKWLQDKQGKRSYNRNTRR